MESKKLNLYMAILKIGLIVIGVIASILVIQGPNAEQTEEVRNVFMESSSLALAINYTMYIIIASIAIVLIFFLVQLISNPKKTLLSIIGILVALILYLIFTMMGTNDTNESLALLEDVQVEQGTIASTTAGIFTVLVGLGIGVLVIVLGPFMGRFRK